MVSVVPLHYTPQYSLSLSLSRPLDPSISSLSTSLDLSRPLDPLDLCLSRPLDLFLSRPLDLSIPLSVSSFQLLCPCLTHPLLSFVCLFFVRVCVLDHRAASNFVERLNHQHRMAPPPVSAERNAVCLCLERRAKRVTSTVYSNILRLLLLFLLLLLLLCGCSIFPHPHLSSSTSGAGLPKVHLRHYAGVLASSSRLPTKLRCSCGK